MRRLVVLTIGAVLTATACSAGGRTSSAPTSARNESAATAASGCTMSQPVDDDLVIPSAIYRGDQRVRVHFTPCTLDQPEPVAILYLLHGAGADETQWSDVGVFDAADTAVIRGDLAPTVIVLPDALPTFSCAECASNYRHHLLDEIEPRIAKLAPLDTARRAIGGISRGGGMALRVAGAHPGDFVAVGGHSSVDVPADTLAAVADARLPVRLDAGHDDSLLATSQQMARALESDGGDVELVESHGGHDRPYWRDHVTDYIAFYAEHLGASSR